MKKIIVILSNPFGYGPVGKAIAIAEAFINSGYKDLIFAGNNFTREIIPPHIKFVKVNERNGEEIMEMLKRIENPVVISSQNRFAIHAACSLGVPSAFLDGLAWFWKNIPGDHLMADEIFWMNYPHIKEKLSKNLDKIHIVPAIIDVKTNTNKQDQTLIHIGGCKNPLVEAFPKYYIDILADGLNNFSSMDKVIVTGGVEAIEYLKSKLNKKKKIEAVSLDHKRFIEELSRSKHFITTAGQTATLEAFALGIPTSFLLPMNLSQMALTQILAEYNAIPQILIWDNYFQKKTDFAMLNEKDAIIELNKHAESINNDSRLKQRVVVDILSLIKEIPNKKGQADFIKYVGVSGAEMIRDILVKKWNLK